jgi:hypothetical protein
VLLKSKIYVFLIFKNVNRALHTLIPKLDLLLTQKVPSAFKVKPKLRPSVKLHHTATISKIILRTKRLEPAISKQGCQMVYFQTKNPNLGNFWRALQFKMFVYFVDIWSTLQPFGIVYGNLVQVHILC